MSNMSELAAIKAELLSCSKVLLGIADSLRDLAHTWDDTEPASPAHPLTLADVRTVLARKSAEGHTTKVHDLLRKYGADKLSQVDGKHYAAMLAEAEGW